MCLSIEAGPNNYNGGGVSAVTCYKQLKKLNLHMCMHIHSCALFLLSSSHTYVFLLLLAMTRHMSMLTIPLRAPRSNDRDVLTQRWI